MKYTREQIEDVINGKCHVVVQSMLVQLLAENDALREDAERLDFVEKNPHIALKWHRKCKWWMDTSINYEKDCFATARQAIDAARQKY